MNTRTSVNGQHATISPLQLISNENVHFLVTGSAFKTAIKDTLVLFWSRNYVSD